MIAPGLPAGGDADRAAGGRAGRPMLFFENPLAFRLDWPI